LNKSDLLMATYFTTSPHIISQRFSSGHHETLLVMTTDILYLRRNSTQTYFDQSGNSWSDSVALPQFPPIVV
jgi:hypothetical protein